MNHSNYMKVSGLIFLVIAILSLWGIMQSTPIAVGTYFVPAWMNWAFVIAGGYLAYIALKKR